MRIFSKRNQSNLIQTASAIALLVVSVVFHLPLVFVIVFSALFGAAAVITILQPAFEEISEICLNALDDYEILWLDVNLGRSFRFRNFITSVLKYANTTDHEASLSGICEEAEELLKQLEHK